MNFTEILIAALSSVFSALLFALIKVLKDYLVQKGGVAAVRTVEILADNAVRAVEQLYSDGTTKSSEKLNKAVSTVRNELGKHNFYFTDEQITIFVEAAVQSMNAAWKGEKDGN